MFLRSGHTGSPVRESCHLNVRWVWEGEVEKSAGNFFPAIFFLAPGGWTTLSIYSLLYIVLYCYFIVIYYILYFYIIKLLQFIVSIIIIIIYLFIFSRTPVWYSHTQQQSPPIYHIIILFVTMQKFKQPKMPPGRIVELCEWPDTPIQTKNHEPTLALQGRPNPLWSV